MGGICGGLPEAYSTAEPWDISLRRGARALESGCEGYPSIRPRSQLGIGLAAERGVGLYLLYTIPHLNAWAKPPPNNNLGSPPYRHSTAEQSLIH